MAHGAQVPDPIKLEGLGMEGLVLPIHLRFSRSFAHGHRTYQQPRPLASTKEAFRCTCLARTPEQMLAMVIPSNMNVPSRHKQLATRQT